MKNAIIYLLIFAAIQILPGSILALVWPMTGLPALSQANLLIISMTLSSVIALMLFIGLRWAQPTRDYLLSHPWVVLLWSGIAAIGTVIPSEWLQEQLPDLPNVVEQELTEVLMHRGGYFVVCLLAPLVEELVFRGAILRALLAWRPERPWVMIAVSALLFALIHMNPAQMPHAFVIGLLLGWMYVRTRSVVPGVVFHWVNNTIAYIQFHMYPAPSLRLVDIFGDERTVGAALIFSMFILLPALFQLKQRM